MSERVALAAIDSAMTDAARRGWGLDVEFFGGEPLLEFPLIRSLCERLWSAPTPVPVHFHATTNGTLVHGPIREWLWANRRRFSCGVSLDGNPAMHDVNRSGSALRIDWEFFVRAWPLQPAKMTVSPLTLLSLAGGVIHLERLGYRVACGLAQGIDWSPAWLLEEYRNQLSQLADHYLAHPRLVPCSLLRLPLDREVNGLSPRCRAGDSLHAVDVDGRVYPCHGFLPFAHGREAVDLVHADDPACVACPVSGYCATCPGENQGLRGDVATRDHARCGFVRTRIEIAARLAAERLLRFGEERSLSPGETRELGQLGCVLTAVGG